MPMLANVPKYAKIDNLYTQIDKFPEIAKNSQIKFLNLPCGPF